MVLWIEDLAYQFVGKWDLLLDGFPNFACSLLRISFGLLNLADFLVLADLLVVAWFLLALQNAHPPFGSQSLILFWAMAAPETLVECLVLGCPFLVADVGDDGLDEGAYVPDAAEPLAAVAALPISYLLCVVAEA